MKQSSKSLLQKQIIYYTQIYMDTYLPCKTIPEKQI